MLEPAEIVGFVLVGCRIAGEREEDEQDEQHFGQSRPGPLVAGLVRFRSRCRFRHEEACRDR